MSVVYLRYLFWNSCRSSIWRLFLRRAYQASSQSYGWTPTLTERIQGSMDARDAYVKFGISEQTSRIGGLGVSSSSVGVLEFVCFNNLFNSRNLWKWSIHSIWECFPFSRTPFHILPRPDISCMHVSLPFPNRTVLICTHQWLIFLWNVHASGLLLDTNLG